VSGPANTQFALAVHMLTLLAGSPTETLSSETLAGSAGANPVHARRVLGQLRRAGIVTSRSGPSGGWQMRSRPEQTTLAAVWRAVQRDAPVLGLHGASPDCPVGQRIQVALTDVDRRATEAIDAELSRSTVADLARETAAEELDSRAAG